MGWFDRQIRMRKQRDQDTFESAIYRMASMIMGRQEADATADFRVIAKAEIDKILGYYRFKPVEIPANVNDSLEQLEYCMRPCGIMRRLVKLEEGWQRDAIGPMLAYLKEGRHGSRAVARHLRGLLVYRPGERKVGESHPFHREAV
jgi:hypothetical protein